MLTRNTLPNRRRSITQKVRIGNRRRTLYLTTDAARSPKELFVRVNGEDCTAELTGLYDVLARLTSLALQYGAPVESVGTMLCGSKFEPCGIVIGHDRIRFCSSLPDAIGQHLLSLSTDAQARSKTIGPVRQRAGN